MVYGSASPLWGTTQMSNELKCSAHCSTMRAFDGNTRSLSLRMVLQKGLRPSCSIVKTLPWYWANHHVS